MDSDRGPQTGALGNFCRRRSTFGIEDSWRSDLRPRRSTTRSGLDRTAKAIASRTCVEKVEKTMARQADDRVFERWAEAGSSIAHAQCHSYSVRAVEGGWSRRACDKARQLPEMLCASPVHSRRPMRAATSSGNAGRRLLHLTRSITLAGVDTTSGRSVGMKLGHQVRCPRVEPVNPPIKALSSDSSASDNRSTYARSPVTIGPPAVRY